MQAIARVNRLHEQKKFGLLIDYRGILAELDSALTEYQNLAVIFKFVTVDSGDAVYRQHTRVRELVESAEKRPWPVYSKDAVEEWLRNPKAPRA